ncbi:DUF423 domain-containing protein [Pseudomarimonas arenosa]|uniref:DUF423 domain-containing protein n=1 Tax=Pseudomarimonas arenosa TaxID=2774145 RepID=A0AAW3ZEW6_9GAMM|nr:DUF423 domain-containing protein [Pseudomarimonas arenosa]MBD8524683.1 DUF423 domain-containing protein [Pseudomarimonas arenosa]
MRAAHPLIVRASVAFGAFSLAAATALSAYAAHGLDSVDQPRAFTAAAMLGLHGLGLLALNSFGQGRLLNLVRWSIMLGSCLFVGSLLAALFWQWRAQWAPFGGSLLILAWLLAIPAVWRASAAKRED